MNTTPGSLNGNKSKSLKSLISIRDTGSKPPLYLIHGHGLSILDFNDLANHLDKKQPVLALQAKGLNENETPLDNINDIAKYYINEILIHNPSGPYSLAGYSSGGFIAFEMRNQLESMGKKVKILAIFDTSAEMLDNKTRRFRRKFIKISWMVKTLIKSPALAINHKRSILLKDIRYFFRRHNLFANAESRNYHIKLNYIAKKHQYAFNNYILIPSDSVIYLFRAQIRTYFAEDIEFLGWEKYTNNEVKVYHVPGDHTTMLKYPNVKEFASILQHVLDKVES